MREILLVGNPNVGKSTLFNTLTKSSVHTGNFHGVTTDSSSEKVKLNGEDVLITDLPGIYSLSGTSNEEKLTRDRILKAKKDIVVLAELSSLRRCMYLCMQLDELNIDYILLINKKTKKNQRIDTDLIENRIKHKVYLIDAKKEKLDEKYHSIDGPKIKLDYLNKCLIKVFVDDSNRFQKICAINGIENKEFDENQDKIKAVYEDLARERYNRIDSILDGAYKANSVPAGHSKLDKVLTNPVLMPILFFALFLGCIYVLFFIIGAFFSKCLTNILTKIVFNPILDFLALKFDSVWLVDFFDKAVFSSVGTIVGFLPQVILLYIFLSVLEDSGIITRLSYVLDDFLSKFGLNGKAVYSLLIGFGCNTMSSLASNNLNESNMRSKCLVISPYISCMARLPVFILIGSCFFGEKTFFVVAGLYVLGLIIALAVSGILNKTILPSTQNDVILEFPPLMFPNLKSLTKTIKKNVWEFLYRVFTVVLSVGIVVYLLSHLGTNFRYTPEITESILYLISGKLSFLLAPIGLDNAGIFTCLIVGILAKELIISTMAIINGVGAGALASSITSPVSLIYFSPASAVSMLVFSLLYSSCASNYAIMKKHKGIILLSIVSQLSVAYLISFIIYQSLTKGVLMAVLLLGAIGLIVFAVNYFVFKVVRNHGCGLCNKCDRK